MVFLSFQFSYLLQLLLISQCKDSEAFSVEIFCAMRNWEYNWDCGFLMESHNHSNEQRKENRGKQGKTEEIIFIPIPLMKIEGEKNW